MRQLRLKIIENKKVAQGFYKMRVESAYFAKNTKPGQFFEVRCSDADELLLRRPLGAHRMLKDGVEILYEVIGNGTKLLSGRKAGEYVDIIGPLGNGFQLPRTTLRQAQGRPERSRQTTNDKRQTTILIAGGIGVAPLVALAEALRKAEKSVTVIIGAKTKSHILCEKEFKSLGCTVSVTTEDGSKGHKGLAADLLLFTKYYLLNTIYACGPNAMLKTVAEIAKERQIPCQVSLEERMACGVGVCLGCPVKVKVAKRGQTPLAKSFYKEGSDPFYKMVCKDGPVFNAEEIAW